jgi:hypothetical protein
VHFATLAECLPTWFVPFPLATKLLQLKLKIKRLKSRKQMHLLIYSQYISAQTGHHQVILEEYTNGD